MNFDPLQKHRAMMANPQHWPCYPVLPLNRRRRDGGLDLGVLIDGVDSLSEATVVRANLLCFPMTLTRLLEVSKEAFGSLDEVLAAGWRVD